MKKKLQKVIGVLSTMKDFNMKPNFSELERKYGIDRHTIKKYYENGGIPERKKFKKVSKWDPLYDLIVSLADVPGSYLMSIFQVLNYEYNGNLPGNYNSFKAYTYRRGIKCAPSNQTPHIYYETEPGEQLQCDWKENLKVHSVNGRFMNSMFSLLPLDIHESMCLFILLEKQKMILFGVCLKHLEDWVA